MQFSCFVSYSSHTEGANIVNKQQSAWIWIPHPWDLYSQSCVYKALLFKDWIEWWELRFGWKRNIINVIDRWKRCFELAIWASFDPVSFNNRNWLIDFESIFVLSSCVFLKSLLSWSIRTALPARPIQCVPTSTIHNIPTTNICIIWVARQTHTVSSCACTVY